MQDKGMFGVEPSLCYAPAATKPRRKSVGTSSVLALVHQVRVTITNIRHSQGSRFVGSQQLVANQLALRFLILQP